MSDTENKTKDQEVPPVQPEAGSEEEAAEDVLSLENLDAVLGAEDPEFFQSLQAIGPDDPEVTRIYEEGVELEYKYSDEKKLWKDAEGVRKLLKTLFPFLPYLIYQWKINSARFRLWRLQKTDQLKIFVKNLGPSTLKVVKTGVQSLSQVISHGFNIFKNYTWQRKVAFVALILGAFSGLFFSFALMSGKMIPQKESLFMTSLQEWSTLTVGFDEESKWEPFYTSTRIERNIFLMNRMVANLKRSENSGANPMAAFEFFVEGTVSDVIVEIKDREPEIEDLFLRVIEEMSFDQISSGEGKKLLGENLKREINKVLSTGQVRHIYYKTAIVKP